MSKSRVRSTITEYRLNRIVIGRVSVSTSLEDIIAMVEGYLENNRTFLDSNCGVYSIGIFLSSNRDMPFDVGKAVGERIPNCYIDRMADSWKWKTVKCIEKIREFLKSIDCNKNRQVIMWHAFTPMESKVTGIRKKEVKEIEDILLDAMIHCANPDFHYSKVGGSNRQLASVRPTWRIRGVQSMRGSNREILRDENARNLTNAERESAGKFERSFALGE